jgi:hypothetical protein
VNSTPGFCVLLVVLRFSKTARRFTKAIVLAALSLAFTAAPSVWASGTGVLEGQVQVTQSMGTRLAEDTSAPQKKVPSAEYPVVVLSKDGRTQVAQVPVNAEGRFRVDLAPGDYLLDVKRQSGRRVRVSARPFTVVAGQTIQVNLDIESGVEPL